MIIKLVKVVHSRPIVNTVTQQQSYYYNQNIASSNPIYGYNQYGVVPLPPQPQLQPQPTYGNGYSC